MAYVQGTVADMKGKTLAAVEVSADKDQIIFRTVEGDAFRMHHWQDCCENVKLAEVIGNLDDLIGAPLLETEEVVSSKGEPKPAEYPESWTWTFYKLGTIKGHVTLRWLGESNGYYSEGVDFAKMA
jgi:hypothetical protein